MSTIAIVIPCHNEQEVLPLLFERLTKAAESWGVTWRVLCVDDGSTDRTWELLARQAKADPRWTALSFSRNFGHQTAVSAGLYHSGEADAVIVLDADLQDPPEILEQFLAAWRDGAEVVYAVRQNRQEGLFKRTAYWFFYRLMNRVTDIEIPLDAGDFCLLDRKVAGILNAMPERNRFLRGMRAWSGFRQVGIPYQRPRRAAGTTKYTFSKLTGLAADGLINFSGVPLKLASQFGFAVSLLALAGVVFTLAQRIFEGWFTQIGLAPVPGYATTVIAILFLGGVQLICLGIIGEYLVRIFEEVKRRPAWVIRESAGVEPRGGPP